MKRTIYELEGANHSIAKRIAGSLALEGFIVAAQVGRENKGVGEHISFRLYVYGKQPNSEWLKEIMDAEFRSEYTGKHEGANHLLSSTRRSDDFLG